MEWWPTLIVFMGTSLALIRILNLLGTSKLSKLSDRKIESAVAVGLVTTRSANSIAGGRVFAVGEGPVIFEISPKEIRLYANPEASTPEKNIPLSQTENWNFDSGYNVDTWRMLALLDQSAPIVFETNGRRHKVGLLRWERQLNTFRPMDTWHEREFLNTVTAASKANRR